MSLRAFGKAVLAGTTVGAVAPTIFSARFGLWLLHEEGGLSSGIYFIFMPIVVTFCLVLTCAVLIGLPVTFVLRTLKRESSAAYAVIGGLMGFAAPILINWYLGEGFNSGFPLLGSLSGTVTGWIWGSQRPSMTRKQID